MQPKKQIAHLIPIAILLTLAASILVAYVTFSSTERLVTTWEMTSLSGISIKSTTIAQPGSMAFPESPLSLSVPQGTILPTPHPWTRASRVTILVMGLDYRDWEANQGPPRSDTMILLSIDPLSHTAGMLSIPRDLWVDIELIIGKDWAKSNTLL